MERTLVGGGGATSRFLEKQGPVGVVDTAPSLGSRKTNLGKPGLHGGLSDTESCRQITNVLDALFPLLAKENARHQEAAGEVVADLFDEVVTDRLGNALVQHVDEAVVENVLELVR